jgi:RNA polymerase sigma-70 factor (ECF subfamily)
LSYNLEKEFVEQLEANQNIVHKICRLYTDNQDAHNDLFQEITIPLWKAYPKFRGDSKFSTWMYRVALNTAITLYRKSKCRVHTQRYETVEFKIEDRNENDIQFALLRINKTFLKQDCLKFTRNLKQ